MIIGNECGREVQATASDLPTSQDPEWVTLAAAAREDIRQIVDDATEVLVSVRASATDDPINLSLPVDASSEADIKVTLRGDRCPDP